MEIFNEKTYAFLQDYLNTFSPTGREWKGQKKWLEYMSPFIDEHHVDNYGSVFGVINPGKDFKVVIEAHADEISWFVNYITKDGFIHVIRNGGSDAQIAPAKRVIIHGEKGDVRGIFGWPAIHVRKKAEDFKTSVEKIFIDVGVKDREEVAEMGIKVGHMITFEDDFMVLNNDYFVGRALDNRIGGFCIAQVARLIKENQIQLPYSLYIVNAVQEEIGLRGAQMVADFIKPNAALITDVTHDTSSPMMKASEQGDIKIGSGPSITFAPAVHYKMLDLIFQAADENEVPYQRSASSRSTGTDTDAFAYSNGGVPSALISLPLRYMHTTVEMVHKKDVEAVTKLIYYTLQKIENGHNFKYL